MVSRASGTAPSMAHQFAAFVLLDLPGKAELGELPIGEDGRLPHLLEERQGKHLPYSQGRIPTRHVKDRRNQSIWGTMPLGTGVVCIPQDPILQAVTSGAAWDDSRRIIDSGRGHRERLEDTRSQPFGVGLAANALYDDPQEKITGIAILALRAGHKIERHLYGGLEELLLCHIQAVEELFTGTIIIMLKPDLKWETRGMTE
jgi:hypothetical protein